MTPSSSVLVSILTTIGIVISLAGASSSTVLLDNLPLANAQLSANEEEDQPQQPETQQEVETLIRQGTVISSQDPRPGHEEMQMATILPFRQDGALYSGIITYTSTAPVEVVILNMQTLNETEQTILNATGDGGSEIPFTIQLDNQTGLSASYIVPSYTGSPVPSASIPFVGNAVWLHTIDGTPFSATYAVNALVLPSQVQNKFNDPLEITDIDTIEDSEETEDDDAGTTGETDTDGVAEQDDVTGAEEELEEDTVDTANAGDDDGGDEDSDETASTAADDDNAEDSDETASTAADDDNAEDPNGVNNQEVVVRIPEDSSSLTDDAYTPNPVEINTGDTVTWINDDSTSHTATSGNPESGPTGMFGGTDESPEIIGPEGDMQSYTFDQAGEFEYYCTLHPNMVGTVIVTEG